MQATVHSYTTMHNESILPHDLNSLRKYFREWRLEQSPIKTEVMCLHLNNKLSNKQLKIYFEDNILPHHKNPKYREVMLDTTLNNKLHLVNTAAKIRTRNNIVHKLWGTSCSSTASVLLGSVLALVYSAVEHCSPVLLYQEGGRSTKPDNKDHFMNDKISSYSVATYTEPYLAPHLYKEHKLVKEYQKIQKNPRLTCDPDSLLL